jgi:hypothetical protein
MTEDWSSQGARLTAEAIKTMMRYLPAEYYEIKLVHDDRENFPVITRHFTRIQLLKSVSFLRRKNAESYHIYFRPEAQHFIFVDDVCEEDIQLMTEDGVRPVLVYETSKGLCHAWVQLANRSDQVSEDDARQARVILAERYSGDKNATGRNQPGRLPGFRNVKVMHEDDKGGHPLVVIKLSCYAPVASDILNEAKKRIACSPNLSPSALLGGGVKSNPTNHRNDDFPIEIYDRGQHIVTMSAQYKIENMVTAYNQALDEMKSNGYVSAIRHSGSGVDRSKQDITVARYLLSNCVSENVVIEVLLHGSEKAENKGKSANKYVIETVQNAAKSLTSGPNR